MIPLYDGFGERYDLMVEWAGRLQRESPFFEAIFREVGARRVIDLGCGTGHHAAHFARLGLAVVGADPSADMLRVARATFPDVASLRFVQAGLGGLRAALPDELGAFDAIVCLGNTLPHAADRAHLDAALADARALLRPGGALIIQILNYDRILAERRRFLGASGRDTPAGAEHVFFRFYDFPASCPADRPANESERLTFNLVTLERDAPGAPWRFSADSTELLPIRSAELRAALAASGFGEVRFLGSYAGEPFDPATSGDLVAVARTARTTEPQMNTDEAR